MARRPSMLRNGYLGDSRGRFGSPARSTWHAPMPRSAPANCVSRCHGLKNGAAASIAFRCGPTDVRILFIGDIFAKSGRESAKRAIPAIVEHRQIDFVIANVE